MKQRWDIFCAVVDNYGDIGVCWRLARQLANEHGIAVRLWVDDLAPLGRLQPGTDVDAEQQTLNQVEVRRWHRNTAKEPLNTSVRPELVEGHGAPERGFDRPVLSAVEGLSPNGRGLDDGTDVVIEAFACELPETYLAAMAARPGKPVWINLEYLSAEAWVEGCHRMTSPHPRLPLTKHFFFPGFTPATGGLLRETDYGARRAAFDAATFRAGLSLPPASEGLTISLFGYETTALPGLLQAWADGDTPITALLPEGRLLPAACAWFGVTGATPGTTLQRGRLTLHVLPFVPQPDYDRLLWLCDLNFVRGEDSFVRAQWAAKPLVWHIYAQDDLHHRVKLDAFLDRYLAELGAPAATALRDFWQAWEEGEDAGKAWPALLHALPRLQAHARLWAEKLANRRDLASELVTFAREAR